MRGISYPVYRWFHSIPEYLSLKINITSDEIHDNNFDVPQTFQNKAKKYLKFKIFVKYFNMYYISRTRREIQKCYWNWIENQHYENLFMHRFGRFDASAFISSNSGNVIEAKLSLNTNKWILMSNNRKTCEFIHESE